MPYRGDVAEAAVNVAEGFRKDKKEKKSGERERRLRTTKTADGEAVHCINVPGAGRSV